MLAEIRSDEGQGPPLVYVPGIDGTGAMLLGAEARWAQRFRVLCLRYRGELPLPAGGDTYEALAASVAQLLARCRIERALVVAESFGGAVALQLALDWPRHVAGLAIVNSFPYYTRRLHLALTRATLPLVPIGLARAIRNVTAPPALFGRLREEDLVGPLRAISRDWLDPGFLRRLRMIARLDLRPRLAELCQPVALFAGDRDRIVDSLPQALAMQRMLRDAELQRIAGGGHLVLPLRQLPWLAWLERLAQRAGVAREAAAR